MRTDPEEIKNELQEINTLPIQAPMNRPAPNGKEDSSDKKAPPCSPAKNVKGSSKKGTPMKKPKSPPKIAPPPNKSPYNLRSKDAANKSSPLKPSKPQKEESESESDSDMEIDLSCEDTSPHN